MRLSLLERSPVHQKVAVRILVKAHTQDVGLIPGRVPKGGNQSMIYSPAFSLPLSLTSVKHMFR